MNSINSGPRVSARSPLVLALVVAAAATSLGQQSDSWPPILFPKSSHPSAPHARVFTVQAPVVISAVAGDGQGNIYLAGYGLSADIPGLSRGFQPKPVGADAIVIKLNARGDVQWSTYLGGRERPFCFGEFCDPPPDWATAIAVDAGGNVYIAGITAAADFPLVNAFNTSNISSLTAGSDGFIAKIAADGRRLVYSSFLGATASALAVGPAGEAWIATSRSVTKLNPTGSPIWTRRAESGGYAGFGVDGMSRVYSVPQQCDTDATGRRACRMTVQQLDSSGTAVLYEATFPNAAILFPQFAVTPTGRAVVGGLSCNTTLPSRRAPGVAAPDCGISNRAWVVTFAPSGEVEAVTHADSGAYDRVISDAEGRIVVLSRQAPAGLPTVRALVDHHVDGPLYVSADRGATWRTMSGAGLDIRGQVWDLDYDAARKSLYAVLDDIPGLYESVDAGRTWQRDRRARNVLAEPNVSVAGALAISNLAIDRRDPSIRYATSRGSVLRHDAMSDWEVALAGVSNTTTAWFPVETNPFDGTVWTATRGSLAISADSGRTWARRPFRTSEPASLFPSSIVFHPARAGTVYVGSNDLWASYDNGESWQSLTSAIQPRPAITAIAIDSTTNILYAGSVARLGVLRSVDDGQTWTATLVGHRITAVAVDPSRPNIVYAGGADPDNRPVLYRSIDRGETWTRIMDGLDIRSEVTQLLLDPRDPSRLYVGARLGEVPFVARLVPVGPLPGRVRTPSATGLARSDFASYLGHGRAQAIASTPTGAIVIALEARAPNNLSTSNVAVVVIDDNPMSRPR